MYSSVSFFHGLQGNPAPVPPFLLPSLTLALQHPCYQTLAQTRSKEFNPLILEATSGFAIKQLFAGFHFLI